MANKEMVSRKITVLSFLMTVAIVIYHCAIWYGDSILTHRMFFIAADTLRDILGSLALGFFFLKTGFLLFNGVRGKTFRGLILSRTKTLMIPFCAWNLLYILKIRLLDGWQPITCIRDLILRFTLEPMDGPLWYIFCIWLFVFVTPAMKKIYESVKASALLFVTLLLTSYVVTKSFDNGTALADLPYIWWLERTLRYLPYYFLGGWIGFSKPMLVWKDEWNRNVRLAAQILMLGAWLILAIWDDRGYFVTWIIYRVFPLLFWIAFDPAWIKKDLPYVFSTSFLIYAMHEMLLIEISSWVSGIAITDGVLVIAVRLALVGIMVGISYLVGLLIRQCSWLNMLLTGGRAK